jgi:excisionase family DNA binding protein
MADAEPEQLQLEMTVTEPAPQPRDARQEDAGRHDQQREPGSRVASSRPRSQPPPTALLTTQETARLLHVHPRTVQRLVERGQLSAIHVGAAVRFDPADVGDLTARLKRRTEAPHPSTEIVGPGRGKRASFAERLRSQQHEHRAAQA